MFYIRDKICRKKHVIWNLQSYCSNLGFFLWLLMEIFFISDFATYFSLLKLLLFPLELFLGFLLFFLLLYDIFSGDGSSNVQAKLKIVKCSSIFWKVTDPQTLLNYQITYFTLAWLKIVTISSGHGFRFSWKISTLDLNFELFTEFWLERKYCLISLINQ